jgi:RNA polymerase sigma factor (sigma-70 family)
VVLPGGIRSRLVRFALEEINAEVKHAQADRTRGVHVVEEKVPPPEEIAETEELRRCVRAALSGLPQDARRALTLNYIVGLRGKELAKSLRRPEGEIARLIEDARAFLRGRLIGSRCRPSVRVAQEA